MTPFKPRMIQGSLEELHKKTMEWESDLEFWKRELEFFRKLIDKFGRRLNLEDDISEREHFKLLLSYYSGELLKSLTQKIIQHESRLKPLLKNALYQDEGTYRTEHSAIQKELNTVENEFQCYKNELYKLIEKVMSNIH